MAEEPKIRTEKEIQDEYARQQKKTFTRWSNQYLSERLLKIEDLEKDLADGVLLCNLLEVISSKKIDYTKKLSSKFAKLTNVANGLKFVASEGLKLVGIGPEDIYDGNLKLILGLIWTLILRYQINIAEGSPKAELLKWVQQQVAPYSVKKPTNFQRDWNDGKVLSALVDSFSPEILTPHDMSGLSGHPQGDTEKAMATALEKYGIARLVDVEDMCSDLPDDLSIMTYIALFKDYANSAASGPHCVAFGPGLEGADTNLDTHFFIQSKNAGGNTVRRGGDPFHVEISGPEHLAPHILDEKNGRYTVNYKPVQPGDYTISVTLRGDHIKDSPFHVTVRGPDAHQSFASGPGVGTETGARIGHPAQFRIHSVSPSGSPVTHGGDSFHAAVTHGPEATGDVPLHDNHDGTYDGAYTVGTPGHYTVEISLLGEPIKGSPFHVLVENGNAGKSWAEGPGLEKGQATKPAEFTIHSVDGAGHPVSLGGDPFKVNVTGPSDVDVQLNDNGDGTYGVTYTTAGPGNYHIEVSLHDSPIKDSPFDVYIKPAPDAGKSWAEGKGLEAGADNEPAEFTVHAVDPEGNPRTDGGDDFVVSVLSPEGEEIPVGLADNGDGTYAGRYDPQTPGDYTVAITLGGEHIKDSPFHVHVKEGTDADLTDLGMGKFAFTVQSKDKRNEPKTFGGDLFEVSVAGPSDATIDVETIDNNDGTYTAWYKLEGPGKYSIAARLNGRSIKGSPYRQRI